MNLLTAAMVFGSREYAHIGDCCMNSNVAVVFTYVPQEKVLYEWLIVSVFYIFIFIGDFFSCLLVFVFYYFLMTLNVPKGIIWMLLILMNNLGCILAYGLLVRLIYLYYLSNHIHYSWYVKEGFLYLGFDMHFWVVHILL